MHTLRASLWYLPRLLTLISLFQVRVSPFPPLLVSPPSNIVEVLLSWGGQTTTPGGRRERVPISYSRKENQSTGKNLRSDVGILLPSFLPSFSSGKDRPPPPYEANMETPPGCRASPSPCLIARRDVPPRLYAVTVRRGAVAQSFVARSIPPPPLPSLAD